MTMRQANDGKFTNHAKEQARQARIFAAYIALGYTEAARPIRDVFHFTATGAQMLDTTQPHRIVGRKIVAKGDGIARGKAAGRVALWAGVSLLPVEA